MSEQTASGDGGGAVQPGAAVGVDAGDSGTPSGAAAGAPASGGDGDGLGEGGQVHPGGDWRAALPDELKESKALAQVADLTDLATQFVNAQGLIGNSIRIPSEHASDEERAQFRQKLLDKVPGLAEVAADDPDAFRSTMRQLGAPEEATGYKLPEFEGELDPLPGFNEWAHEANLTQAQFDTLARRFTEAQLAGQAESRQQHDAEMESLHREWGYAFDDKLGSAMQAAKLTNAPDDFIEAMEQNRVPAKWVRYFSTLAENFGESDIGSTNRQERPEMTPAEAGAQLREIMSNKQHDYWTAMAGTPEKEAAVAEVMRLRERSMGKGSRAVVATFNQPDEVTLG